jgi:hypothetical protein
MKYDAKELLNELTQRTLEIKSQAELLKEESEKDLNFRMHDKSWSVLECLEHLNMYGDFYLPEIEQQITQGNSNFQPVFRSTWFANRTVLGMLPQESGEVKSRMNAFKNKNPIHSNLPITTLNRFLKQQEGYLQLIEKAGGVNLTQIKTAITLPLIKFRLGDTLRFVVYHNTRHMVQAQRVLNAARIYQKTSF